MGGGCHAGGIGQAVAGGCAAAVEGGGERAVPGIFSPAHVRRLNLNHALTLTAGNGGVTGHLVNDNYSSLSATTKTHCETGLGFYVVSVSCTVPNFGGQPLRRSGVFG